MIFHSKSTMILNFIKLRNDLLGFCVDRLAIFYKRYTMTLNFGQQLSSIGDFYLNVNYMFETTFVLQLMNFLIF